MTIPRVILLGLGLAGMFPFLIAAQDQAAPPRKPVRTQADLPRYEYRPGTPTASALLEDDAAFAKVSEQFQRDTETTLRDDDVQDPATLRLLNAALKNLALLRRDFDAAARYMEAIAAPQDKPSAKLLSGLRDKAIIAALRTPGDSQAKTQAFRKALQDGLAPLPWNDVQAQLREWKGFEEISSSNYFLGMAQQMFDPGYSKTGAIDWATLDAITYLRVQLRDALPYREALLGVLDEQFKQHASNKPEIWSARAVSLDGKTGLSPVVIGIWDSGVDLALFPDQTWTNPAEVPGNGRDDDGNGFVDDIHGLGFDSQYRYDGLALLPISPSERPELPRWRLSGKGYFDLMAGVDSAEADQLRTAMSQADAKQAAALQEGGSHYLSYAHGTHVAGIAVQGNPAARILNVRIESPWELVPAPITRTLAEAGARSMRETVAYFRAHKVRVVNMSWRLTAAYIEESLKANGLGGNDAERKAQAEASFKLLVDALTESIRSAPEILFVPGAGNSDDDVDFVQAIPAGIDLPNVLTAGGVDRAGDDAAFTSTGKLVRIYTNGVAVESFVPGGERLVMSGTSMSAPQVTNLAAKLLALDPALAPAEVIGLILDGATRSEDGRRLLMDQKRSVQLLQDRRIRRARPGSGAAEHSR